MKIVGCDLHTRYQQVAMLDKQTGELIERRLEHESGEARAFYSGLSAPVPVAHVDLLFVQYDIRIGRTKVQLEIRENQVALTGVIEVGGGH